MKGAPGHYEQKKPFILYKFDDLQSRISKLKSVENFKKEFKRDSVTIKKQSPTYLLLEFDCYWKFMKHKSNKSSIQNVTVSNLLNRLESLNFCTYAETKEYHEALRQRLLPQKLKFLNERKFGNITVSEQYFIN